MGSRVSVDPSHLLKIFQLQRHIGTRLIDSFIAHCGLSGTDAEYFSNLVRFNKAKTESDKKTYYERLIALKGVNAQALNKDQYEFYTKWYYSAILTLLDFYPFREIMQRWLKSFLRLLPRQGPQIDTSLSDLGLIRKNENGIWELTHQIITTGEKYRSDAVKAFQESTMQLAVQSLYRHPAEKRNISTVTVTIAEKTGSDKSDYCSIPGKFTESSP